MKAIHVSTFQNESLYSTECMEGVMLHFFHICNSIAFNVDSNLNTAKPMCQESNSYFLFRLQVYIWWTLYHTAWFTSQESCCSHTATRVLSLKRKWCHNEPSFLLFVRIFFLEILCAENLQTNPCQCKTCQKANQNKKKYAAFPKCSDQLGGPGNLVFNGYLGSFLEVKWPKLEADLPAPPNVKLRMAWMIPLVSYLPSLYGQQKLLQCLYFCCHHISDPW